MPSPGDVQGFGVFSIDGGPARIGWRAGDSVVDLTGAGLQAEVAGGCSLNPLLALPRRDWEDVVERIVLAVARGAEPRYSLGEVELHLPFEIGDFVDFYSSIHHATNLGRLFRPDAKPLLPNWRWLPVGYHGRAGTVVVSGTEIQRPWGQIRPSGEDEPAYAPSQKLDFELELGFVVGAPSRRGVPLPTGGFREHVYGVVVVNDWSARDIQAWEYQPLGPFLGKSFATSISAWVTPLALLEDSFVSPVAQHPTPPAYLRGGPDAALDVSLTVNLNGTAISETNSADLYWTVAQQVAHVTVNGAHLRTGDLIATGTISGATCGSEGSMIELTENGSRPLVVNGEERRFLEDGDEVVLTARSGQLALGEVRGRVVPPHPPSDTAS